MLGELLQHLTYSLRTLRRNPGVSAAAVITLALGIGANTAIFSVVNGVLLQPLPYKDASRLCVLRIDLGSIRGVSSLSIPERDDLERDATLLDGVTSFAAFSGQFLAVGDRTEPVNTAAVWYNVFSVLGVAPMMGRDFYQAENVDPERRHVMILSYDFWKNHLGGDPKILGKSLEYGGALTQVIGVLPSQFQFPNIQGRRGISGVDPDIWIPLNFLGPVLRSAHSFRSIARLRKGATIAAAQAQIDTISVALTRQYADYQPGGIQFKIERMQTDFVGETRRSILALAGAVGFVLLIGCSNVTTLLIARWKARDGEIAVRTALGASSATIVRLVLTESLVLSLLAGCLGVGLAYGGVSLLQHLKPANFPRLEEIHVDLTALVIAASVSLWSSLLFGILPAIQTSRLKIAETLRGGTRSSAGVSRGRLMKTLVTVEVALCTLLLIASGLLIRTFTRLQKVDPGFDASNTLTFKGLLDFQQTQTRDFRITYYDQLQRRIAALPGVRSVGGTSILPFGGAFQIEGYAYNAETLSHFSELTADYRSVTPGYFETLRTPLAAGRFFNGQDGVDGRLPIIVDDLLATAAWPASNPIGRKFWIMDNGPHPGPILGEVVGVVRHLRMHQLSDPGAPQVFIPVRIASRIGLGGVNDFVIRVDGDPSRIVAGIRQAAKDLNRYSAAINFETMQDRLNRATAATQFELVLMSIFAAIAMVLAIVGLYGVIAYTVIERWREMGIRIALGAKSTDIFNLILWRGMRMSLAGIAIGLAAALLITPWLRSMLYGVTPSDPSTYLLVAAILAATSAAACYVPARRATLSDPIDAIRSD